MSRSFLFVAILACLLGFAVAFGLIYTKYTPVAETSKDLPAPTPPPPLVPKDWDFWTLESGSLSEELIKERQTSRERAKDLDAWQAKLEAEKVELVRIREQTEAIREEIDKNVITLLESEKPNLKALARSYTIMKPPKAVAIFEKTNDDIVVKILSLMKPDNVAAILGEMGATPSSNLTADATTGPTRAAHLSEMLRLLKQEDLKKPAAP